MKIGIFVACLGRNDAGPETYERELISHIAASPKGHEYHVYCFTPNANRAVPGKGEHLRAHTLWPGIRPVAASITLPLMLLRHGIDVYHATFVPSPIQSARAVFTMHDVSPFTHPQFYPGNIRRRLAPLIQRGLSSAEVIICVSENCRQTTEELFGIEPSRLKVVPHGVSNDFKPMDRAEALDRVKQKFQIEAPYILYVGKLEARKNISRLLRGYQQFRQETGLPHKLVLAGRRFWDLHDIDNTIASLGIKQDIIELGYVPDGELVPLYSGAEAFLFPSLWEGFGFPIAEAMKCGAPVITSNVSCLPEVAGGAAELVNPEKTEEIAAALAKVLGNETLRQDMIRKGLVQSARFTWESTARKTIEAYEAAAN
ncbi:MAG: glycosyltransferase family 4 protein [Verrucomicrobiota bacterium]